jgi:hypothetical protein
MLRLLKNDPSAAFDHPELRQELLRLFQLLQRIDELAGEEFPTAAPLHEFPDSKRKEDGPVSDEKNQPEPDLGPELVAFDPSEFGGYAPEDNHASQDPGNEHADTNPPVPYEASEEEYPARWWVNFNGDISLERLATLRRMLTESPFTIEVRFDEITDGLIVLKVVTEHNISMDQMDWLIKNVMQLVGMDQNAAILSQN